MTAGELNSADVYDYKAMPLTAVRPSTREEVVGLLTSIGLRPTRERTALARMLFSGEHRHLTAEVVHQEALKNGTPMCLATTYNNLNQFVRVGLLRQVFVDGSKTYYDTNTTNHHHVYLEESRELIDIPDQFLALQNLPAIPDGYEFSRLNIVIRLRKSREV